MLKASFKAFRECRNARLAFALFWTAVGAGAQTCQTASDMEAPVRSALETTAKRYFDMVSRGDSAALQQNAIPSLATNFGDITAAVKDNQAAFAGAKGSVRPPFLLLSDGKDPLPRAEFLCGVFGSAGQTKDSAVFVLTAWKTSSTAPYSGEYSRINWRSPPAISSSLAVTCSK